MGLLSRRGKAVIVGSGGPHRKRRVKLASRLRLGALFALALGLVLLALREGRREADQRIALADIDRILAAARAFRQDMERCPHDLEELTHPPAGGVPYLREVPEDPWGRPYAFRCPGRWLEDEVDVASRGPDGQWEGGDDITTDH